MTTITQADRDAAAKFVRKAWHLFWPDDHKQAMQDARDIQAGLCDSWLLVVSFAERAETAFEAGAKAMQKAAIHKATSFLVGDPRNGVPLHSPSPHEIADAIAALSPAQIAGGGK